MSKVLLDIDNNMVSDAVKGAIAEAITEKLGGIKTVAQEMVKYVLELKVDESGKVNPYSAYNKFCWLELTIQNQIRDFSKECIVSYMQEHRAEIQKAVVKELQTSHKKLAAALINGIEGGLHCQYSHSVNVSIDSQKD